MKFIQLGTILLVAALAGFAAAQVVTGPTVQRFPATAGPPVAAPIGPGAGGGILAFTPIGFDLWHQPNLGTPVVYQTPAGAFRAATIIADYGTGVWDLITYENASQEPLTVSPGTPVHVPSVALGVAPGEFFYVGFF